MVNPFFQQVIGSLVRAVLMGASVWAVQHGIFTDNEAGKIIEAATMAIVGLLWSVSQKFTDRQKLNVALTTPAALSEQELEELILRARQWGGKLPSVTTPKDVTPSA